MAQVRWSPTDKAASCLAHEVKRYALVIAKKNGFVTTRDIQREYPALEKQNGYIYIQSLVKAGILRPRGTRLLRAQGDYKARITYELCDLTGLRDLHKFLGELLEISNG